MSDVNGKAQEAALDAQHIADHRTVEEFLKQPAAERVLKRIEQECFEAFVKAQTEEERYNAWAKSQGMQMFLASLKGTKTNAVMAHQRVEQRELEARRREQQQQPQRNPRRG